MDTSVKTRVVSLPNKKMLVAIQFPEKMTEDGWKAATQRVWDEIQVKRGRIGLTPQVLAELPVAPKKGKAK